MQKYPHPIFIYVFISLEICMYIPLQCTCVDVCEGMSFMCLCICTEPRRLALCVFLNHPPPSFFETTSLTEPRGHQFNYISWPVSSLDPPVTTVLMCGTIGMCHHIEIFTRVLEIQTQDLRLGWQAFDQLNYLTSHCYFISENSFIM